MPCEVGREIVDESSSERGIIGNRFFTGCDRKQRCRSKLQECTSIDDFLHGDLPLVLIERMNDRHTNGANVDKLR